LRQGLQDGKRRIGIDELDCSFVGTSGFERKKQWEEISEDKAKGKRIHMYD